MRRFHPTVLPRIERRPVERNPETQPEIARRQNREYNRRYRDRLRRNTLLPLVTHIEFLNAMQALLTAQHNQLLERLERDLNSGALVANEPGISQAAAMRNYADIVWDQRQLDSNPIFQLLVQEAASRSYSNPNVNMANVDSLMRQIVPPQLPVQQSLETVDSESDEDSAAEEN